MTARLFISLKRSFSLFAIVCFMANEVVAQNTTWAVPLKPNSTVNNVNVTDVEFDASGNVFATGSFRGTVNFNFNGTATNATSAGGHDIFLAKYNASGILQWLKTIGGTADDVPTAIDIQGTSIVIAGTFVSTNVDFDPGTGTNILSSSGLTDIFVAKFDGTGSHLWAQRAGGTQGELVTDVELDGNSNVFIAGSFTSIMDFFSNTNTQPINGARDAFVCKLDVSGVYQWVKVIGGAGTDVSNRLTVFGNNSILLCVDIGYSASSTTFDGGSGTSSFTFSGTSGTNGIVSDFNSSGVYGNTMHFKGNSRMVKMMAYNNENIAIGTFSGTMDIDPTSGVTNVTSTGASDMFMVNTGFVTSGSLIAYGVVNGIGSSDGVYPSNATMKVNTNYQTDLYITGYAKGAINFGGTSASDLQGSGANDYSFLVRLNHDHFTANDFQLRYTYKNAFPPGSGSTEFGRGNGLALNTTNGDLVLGGYYYSTAGSPNSVVFNPGNISVSQTFSTASMGYIQYINGCIIPNTIAASNDYSICAGQTATLTVSGATTYSWNTGSTAASFTVAPTTTTTYTVTGAVAGGCAKIDTVKITVTNLPNTVASSTDYSKCAGQSTTLNASGATTYSWNTGSTATSFTVAPTTTTTYTLTGTTNGCSKTDTVKITVTALPNVIGVSNDYTTCAGTTATLSATGGTTYSWNTGSAATSFTVAPTTTTTYTVTGTTAGCSKTDTVKLTVTALPNVIGSSNDYTTCAGVTATLTASGASTYSWNTGSTATSFTVAPTTTTTYTVTGTTAGCSKTDTVKMTVTALPNIIGSSNDYSLCSGQTATLTGTGGTTYSWNTGSTSTSFTVSPTTTTTYTVTGTTSGCSKTDTVKLTVNTMTVSITPASASICSGSGSNAVFTASGASTYSWSAGPSVATYTVSPSLTTTYTVTGTSSAGCTKTATAVVSVSSAAVINVTPNAPTICSGGSGVSLVASGANTYTWTSGPATAAYTVNPTGTTTYTVTGTAAGGCTGTTAVLVTVANKPTVTTTANNYTICEGNSATVSAIGASTYSWNTGSTASTATVVPTSTTTYTVTGTSSQGCTGTSTVTITVNPIPDNSVTVNDPTLTAIETGATYQWLDCGNNQPVVGATNQLFTASANGSYKVQVTKNGCVNTSVCQSIGTVGITNYDPAFEIKIYPNPATNSLNINNLLGDAVLVQLFNSTGDLVYTDFILSGENVIDLKNFAHGIYVAKLNSANYTSTQKIVIE